MVLPASHKVSRVPWYSGSDPVLHLFAYRTITFYGVAFQLSSITNFNLFDLSATPDITIWFGLFPFRSPLLRESIFLSLPPGT